MIPADTLDMHRRRPNLRRRSTAVVPQLTSDRQIQNRDRLIVAARRVAAMHLRDRFARRRRTADELRADAEVMRAEADRFDMVATEVDRLTSLLAERDPGVAA